MSIHVPSGVYEIPDATDQPPIPGERQVVAFANASPFLSIGHDKGLHTALNIRSLFELCNSGAGPGLVTPEKTQRRAELRTIFGAWSSEAILSSQNDWTQIGEQHIFTDLVPQIEPVQVRGQDIINALIERIDQLKSSQSEGKLGAVSEILLILHELPVNVQFARSLVKDGLPSVALRTAIPTFVRSYDPQGPDKGVSSWHIIDSPIKKALVTWP